MEADLFNATTSAMRQTDNHPRFWLSWKIWTVMCLLSLAAIAALIALPFYRRWEAFKYLDERRVRYELTDESEWITERFGDRARAFRSVRFLEMASVPEDAWTRVAVFNETEIVFGSIFYLPFPVSQQAVDALRQLSLKQFQVQNRYFTDELLADLFSARPPLVDVSVSSSGMSRRALWELSHIPSIEKLTLHYNDSLVDDDYRDLPPLPALRRASIDSIGDQGMKWLGQSPLLEEILVGTNSSGIPITAEGLAAIGELKALTWLALFTQNVDSGGIAHLEQLPRLRTISLPSECITWETIESFRRMPSLERISVRGPLASDLQTALASQWEVSVTDLSALIPHSDTASDQDQTE